MRCHVWEAVAWKAVNFVSCSEMEAETDDPNVAMWLLLGLSFRFCEGHHLVSL